MQTAGSPYPVIFAFDPPERVANWRALANWLLAIPQLVIVSVLRTVAEVLAVVSWFAIVFTGRLPRGIADFQAMYLRTSMRTQTYAMFLREEYPPFRYDMAASDAGDDPRVRVDVAPDLDGRNRLTTAFRVILAIPQLLAVAVVGIGVAVAMIGAFFVVLFTGRWPVGLREFVLGWLRWYLRLEAYLLLLTDLYPPFGLS